jgi:hypothetical protein
VGKRHRRRKNIGNEGDHIQPLIQKHEKQRGKKEKARQSTVHDGKSAA